MKYRQGLPIFHQGMKRGEKSIQQPSVLPKGCPEAQEEPLSSQACSLTQRFLPLHDDQSGRLFSVGTPPRGPGSWLVEDIAGRPVEAPPSRELRLKGRPVVWD